MTETAIIKRSEFTRIANPSVTDYMTLLCEYGKPRLCSQGNGEWFCTIDMFVQGSGVEFKVASTFQEPSMLQAVKTCYERLDKALKDLGL